MEKIVKDLQAEIVKLENQVSSTRQKLRDTHIAMYIRDTGINIGDEVIIDKTKRARITSLNFFMGLVVPIVQFYLPSGVLGKRGSSIHSRRAMEKYPSPDKIENKGE